MKRPDFIKHYTELTDDDNCHYTGDDELLSIGSPVGRKLGLTNIGVHIETIPPGRRTSFPHAEKEEEEFAYVISGNPQAWIDGDIFDLTPGDFIALPAGTGIAHTFINNTNEVAIMLVGGDSNKKNNQIFYPLNPAQNDEFKKKGLYWGSCPNKLNGNHDGRPDQK